MAYALREILETDLDLLREHRNRIDTRCYLGNANPVTEAQQRAWWEKHDRNAYKVVQVNGADVGLVRVTDVDDATACVGSDVFFEHRGKGYGHMAFAAACDLADERVGVFRDLARRRLVRRLKPRSLWLRVFIENERAVRIYGKAGFVVDQNATVEVYPRITSEGGALRMLHYVRMVRHHQEPT